MTSSSVYLDDYSITSGTEFPAFVHPISSENITYFPQQHLKYSSKISASFLDKISNKWLNAVTTARKYLANVDVKFVINTGSFKNTHDVHFAQIHLISYADGAFTLYTHPVLSPRSIICANSRNLKEAFQALFSQVNLLYLCSECRNITTKDSFDTEKEICESCIIEEELSELEEKFCSICQTMSKKTVKTSCGHDFHARCLIKLYHNTSKCPLCRKELSDEDVFQG